MDERARWAKRVAELLRSGTSLLAALETARDEILADNDQRQTGGTDVFLRSGENQAEFGDIYRSG